MKEGSGTEACKDLQLSMQLLERTFSLCFPMCILTFSSGSSEKKSSRSIDEVIGRDLNESP